MRVLSISVLSRKCIKICSPVTDKLIFLPIRKLLYVTKYPNKNENTEE